MLGAATSQAALEETLKRAVLGEVRFDRLARTMYSTDASIYEIVPAGVVFPQTIDDIVATVRACKKHGTPIVPRGAGTGLTGGALGAGVQLDLSRHMHQIGHVDPVKRTVEVDPGVVLDHLNTHLAEFGLHFAPDVATSSRATIGGMIANNSCGAHSVVFGRTVDHVEALQVVLSDGECVTFQSANNSSSNLTQNSNARSEKIENGLRAIRDRHFDEIQKRFPKILRSNGGYGLDRLGAPSDGANPIQILCGSEGTLGIVVRATLKLLPLPKAKALAVLHFRELLPSLRATVPILQHNPSAVELVDEDIIKNGLANAKIGKRCDFLQGKPAAILIVEFLGDCNADVSKSVENLACESQQYESCYAATQVVELDRQTDVWNLRKAGLGLLMSKPGDHQPQAFVEDTAVPPDRLAEYIKQLQDILAHEGITANYYAHASVGCLHVRPAINLKQQDDIQCMHRIAGAVSDLAVEFGGAMTGEHGDGLVRSCWAEKMFGNRILGAFREVKSLFDPDNLLNPNKIVGAPSMTDNLRWGSDFVLRDEKATLDFSSHGGVAGLAGMCSGVGQCRQTQTATMCPSYMATLDETHTTRARANALRVALSNRGLLDGLSDPALAEVMDLCISCKACKSECPTGVDMAQIKAEYLFRKNLEDGVMPRSRLIADMSKHARRASWFPRLANMLGRSNLVRSRLESRFGLDRRFPLPRFASRTFRSWFRRYARQSKGKTYPRGLIVYFVDTWTNYFAPEVGRAAVTLLARLGYDVRCPETLCCGRPAISKGLLSEAAQMAEANVLKLGRFARAGVPIVGTEPSCILSFVDEYPQLVRNRAARRLAGHVETIETFLAKVLYDEPTALEPLQDGGSVLYHGHCHQKAEIGTDDANELLARFWPGQSREIDSGCCGMAGSFGHEKEHYDIAKAIGEQRLFPSIRECDGDQIAISGFSCREQIDHHTGATPKHLVELLAERLA